MQNGRIRKVDLTSGIITTIAGGGWAGEGFLGTQVVLSNPQWVAVDGAGNVYVSDAGLNRILKIDSITHVVRTVAGNEINGSCGDGGAATSARISPGQIVADSQGNLYFTDGEGIRRVDRNGIVTLIYGLNNLNSLAIDRGGQFLYFVPPARNHIMRLNLQMGTVSVVAGSGANGIATEGVPATSTQVQGIVAIGSGPNSDIYLAE
jgi:streptogramin lyase